MANQEEWKNRRVWIKTYYNIGSGFFCFVSTTALAAICTVRDEGVSVWKLLTKLRRREFQSTAIFSSKCKIIPVMLWKYPQNDFQAVVLRVSSIWWVKKVKWIILHWYDSFKIARKRPWTMLLSNDYSSLRRTQIIQIQRNEIKVNKKL